MSLWQERLGPDDAQIMLPHLLLSLDRIRDQAMPPERRLAMLRSLKDQVETIQKVQRAADLSPVQGWPMPVVNGLTLEQRLGRSWCNNLQRLLTELGQPRYQGNARFAVYREWTLRQLTRGFSRVIESAVRADRPAPGGIWRSLHELFLHLEGRDELDGPAIPVYQRLRPGEDYKRLLLIGSLGEYYKADRIYREIGPSLRDWAAESELARIQCGLGDTRVVRVDVGADLPPYRYRPQACEPSNAWVLRPPRAFCEALEHFALRETFEPEEA